MKSYERLNKSKNNTVWLTEERILINVNDIINHVEIWLKDSSESSSIIVNC